jgi:uncharacterized protein involved in outer membrane biogenesis
MAFPTVRWSALSLRQFPRRLARSKLLWSLAALLLVYTLGGFLLAPYLVERYVPSLAEQHLGRAASIEKVRVNPFTLTFEASGFRLEDGPDGALLAFKRLFVDFELSSIFRRAWTFADIRLEGADLALVIDRNGRLNLLDVLDRLRKPPQPDEPPPRLVVHHLIVDDSRVSLTDFSGATRASAAVTPIDFELSNLSTLADSEGQYTLDARLPGGGTLAWKGSVSLEPIASAGELVVKGFKLETVWAFLRDELNLTQPRGELTVSGAYGFTHGQGQTALSVHGVQAELTGLFIALRDEKQPLLALRTIRMSDASFALGERELVVKKVLLADGALNASVSDSGALDWQRITSAAPRKQTKPVDAATGSPARPWRIRAPSIAIEKVALGYADHTTQPALSVGTAALNGGLTLDITSGEGPARVVADDIALTLAKTAATIPGAETRYGTIDALTVAGGRIDTKEQVVHAKLVEMQGGDLRLAIGPTGPEGLLKALSAPAPASNVRPESTGVEKRPRSKSGKRGKTPPQAALQDGAQPWRIQVEKIGIGKLALQYDHNTGSSALALRVGELNSDFKLEATAGAGSAGVIAGDLRLAIDRIVLNSAGADAPLATLDSFRLTGGRIDTGERLAAAKTVALGGGGVRIVRGPDGAISLIDAFSPPKAGKPAPASAAKDTAADAPWRYRVDNVAVKGFAVALADRTFKPAIAYDVDVPSVTLSNVDAASRKPIAFKAALRVGKDGTLNSEGTLQQDFGGANAQVALARMRLEPLQPLLAKHAALDLKSGQLSAKARVAYRRGAQPALLTRGQFAVDDFLVNEAASGDRFASWKTLGADGVELSLSPDRFAIRQMRLLQPGAKIVIAKDRTINVTQVIRKEPAPEGERAKAAAPSKPAASEPPAFPWEIGTIRFDNGILDFADLSLVLPFATQVQALNGAIVGISSDPGARAELKLSGQVDQYGEAHAAGVLIPRDPEAFLDITARFTNVDMPLLSPYSATFAGRKVAAGKLSLVLEYKIVKSELAGENKIVLRDFRLGERVEAPNAMDLPLDLAIALLKDSEGTIRLAVPVRGNVGNPEFDYGKVIRTAIGNVIGRIVTAPFRALAGLFGKSDAEEVRMVRFAPGSDSIAPAQREQLDALAKALKARPQLGVVVKGPYDETRDARQLRRARARLALAQALRAKLAPGEDPGPIAYGRADTQRALEALLSQRAGPGALAELEKSYAKRTGKQPERVNPVLGLIGRGSKDTEFYEAVFERLVDVEPLPDTAVRVLAANRAEAIADALAKAGVERARIQSGGITQVKADSRTAITTELALSAVPGAS